MCFTVEVRHIRMLRRVIKDQKADERETLENSNSPEIPCPGPKFIAITRGDRSNNNGNIHSQVGNDHANVTPLVRQQFRKCKCSHLTRFLLSVQSSEVIRRSTHLAVRSAETRDSKTGDNLVRIFGRCHNDMTDEANQVTQNKEPTTAEKIGVWTAVIQ